MAGHTRASLEDQARNSRDRHPEAKWLTEVPYDREQFRKVFGRELDADGLGERLVCLDAPRLLDVLHIFESLARSSCSATSWGGDAGPERGLDQPQRRRLGRRLRDGP